MREWWGLGVCTLNLAHTNTQAHHDTQTHHHTHTHSQEACVHQCLAAALHLHLILPTILRHVTAHTADARVFFNWLLHWVRSLTSGDEHGIGTGTTGAGLQNTTTTSFSSKTPRLHDFVGCWLLGDPIGRVLEGVEGWEGLPETQRVCEKREEGGGGGVFCGGCFLWGLIDQVHWVLTQAWPTTTMYNIVYHHHHQIIIIIIIITHRYAPLHRPSPTH